MSAPALKRFRLVVIEWIRTMLSSLAAAELEAHRLWAMQDAPLSGEGRSPAPQQL